MRIGIAHTDSHTRCVWVHCARWVEKNVGPQPTKKSQQTMNFAHLACVPNCHLALVESDDLHQHCSAKQVQRTGEVHKIRNSCRGTDEGSEFVLAHHYVWIHDNNHQHFVHIEGILSGVYEVHSVCQNVTCVANDQEIQKWRLSGLSCSWWQPSLPLQWLYQRIDEVCLPCVGEMWML